MERSLCILGVLALLALSGCIIPPGGGCPCGASTSDPISAHDPRFAGVHEVESGVDCGDLPCTTEVGVVE
jgi:hypothetical protein